MGVRRRLLLFRAHIFIHIIDRGRFLLLGTPFETWLLFTHNCLLDCLHGALRVLDFFNRVITCVLRGVVWVDTSVVVFFAVSIVAQIYLLVLLRGPVVAVVIELLQCLFIDLRVDVLVFVQEESLVLIFAFRGIVRIALLDS